jgi:predicted esterase
METLEASFSFKARYFKLGQIDENTLQIWFVLHGYGQLAQFFLRKFQSLESRNCCVIAPEGLSKFYHSEILPTGTRASDKVGATWMTKENRLMDIENYVHYLNEIYKLEVPQSHSSKINVLGFSQGAATASRWIMDNTVPFDRLILWAGAFPPDMDFEKGRELLQSKEVIEVYGTQDPFINKTRIEELTALNDRLNIQPTIIHFEGKHEIDEATLLKLV